MGWKGRWGTCDEKRTKGVAFEGVFSEGSLLGPQCSNECFFAVVRVERGAAGVRFKPAQVIQKRPPEVIDVLSQRTEKMKTIWLHGNWCSSLLWSRDGYFQRSIAELTARKIGKITIEVPKFEVYEKVAKIWIFLSTNFDVLETFGYFWHFGIYAFC